MQKPCAIELDSIASVTYVERTPGPALDARKNVKKSDSDGLDGPDALQPPLGGRIDVRSFAANGSALSARNRVVLLIPIADFDTRDRAPDRTNGIAFSNDHDKTFDGLAGTVTIIVQRYQIAVRNLSYSRDCARKLLPTPPPLPLVTRGGRVKPRATCCTAWSSSP